jgi:uncharacterized membrane protein YdjX (TVP38/TMEM64 family)
VDIVNFIIDYSTEFISTGGILFGFFLVFIECFIPALPLSVFVTLNINAFGFLLGVVISWIATCTGSFLCYLLFSFIEEKFLSKLFNRKFIKKISNNIDKFRNISFSLLVLILTLPFTPSFLINILAGLAGISREKYITALLIGKAFMIIFWGYIGSSLLKSLTDIYSIIYIIIALGLAYIISKIISHRLDLE